MSEKLVEGFSSVEPEKSSTEKQRGVVYYTEDSHPDVLKVKPVRLAPADFGMNGTLGGNGLDYVATPHSFNANQNLEPIHENSKEFIRREDPSIVDMLQAKVHKNNEPPNRIEWL